MSTTASLVDLDGRRRAARLTDEQRVEMSEALLFSFRDDLEYCLKELTENLNGGTAQLADVRATFKRLERLSGAMDALPMVGSWNTEDDWINTARVQRCVTPHPPVAIVPQEDTTNAA